MAASRLRFASTTAVAALIVVVGELTVVFTMSLLVFMREQIDVSPNGYLLLSFLVTVMAGVVALAFSYRPAAVIVGICAGRILIALMAFAVPTDDIRVNSLDNVVPFIRAGIFGVAAGLFSVLVIKILRKRRNSGLWH